ncbi:MAG: sensor histidine kinase [Nonlabens sp.]
MKVHYLFLVLFAFHFNHLVAQDYTVADSIITDLDKLDKKVQVTRLQDYLEAKEVDPLTYSRLGEYYIQLSQEQEDYDAVLAGLVKTMDVYVYTMGDPVTTQQLFDKYGGTALKSDDSELKAALYRHLGNSYGYLGNYTKAIEVFFKAAEFKHDNLELKADILEDIAKGQAETGELAKASSNVNQSIELRYKTQDSLGLIDGINLLSTLYARAGFYDMFHDANDEAILLAQKAADYRNLLGLYYNKATTYDKIGDYPRKVEFMKKSLEASQKFEGRSFIEPRILTSYIAALLANDQVGLASQYMDTLDARPPHYKQPPNDRMLDLLDGLFAYAKADYPKAAQVMERQVELQMQGVDYDNQLATLNQLALIYEKTGETDKELRIRKQYYVLNDSIIARQNRNALSYYQTLYETEKRDNIIKNRELELQRLDESIKTERLYYAIIILFVLLVAAAITYWRYRKNQQVKEQLQRTFTQDIINSVELERKRISHELHDSVGNSLLLIRNKLINDQGDLGIIDDTIDEVREMSHRMHPFNFEKQGLLQSLQSMVEDLQEGSAIFYSLDTALSHVNIPVKKNIQIYRIIQEAVNNVEKHAAATACQISVDRVGNNYIFKVQDNGKGLPSIKSMSQGLGLRSMEERAHNIGATLNLTSKEQEGTLIELTVSE